ncbi:hypothetical protein GGR56DRAFT_685622 [Xylariaceae sp. FL0804]|nr:hypothetical protein GGR56DRAFT_685622 [Xylariaceae sp. FL0804]
MASRKQPQSSLRASTGTPARGAGVPPASSRVIDLTVWDSDADADEDAEQAACTERNNKNLISGGGGGDDTTASRAHHVASSRRGSSRKDPYEVPDSESDALTGVEQSPTCGQGSRGSRPQFSEKQTAGSTPFPVRSPAVEGTRPSLAGNSQASPQHVKGDYANAAARTHLPAIKVEDVRRICRTTQADPKAEARDPVDWKESAPGGSSDVLDTTSSDGKPNPVSPMLSQPPVNEETVGPVFQSHIGPPAASRTSGPIERKAWWNPWDWSKRHYGTEFETSYVVGGLLGQSWIGNGPFRGYIISGPGEGGYIVGCRAPSDETLLQADLESAEVLAEDGEAASDNNWASDQFPDVEESDASDPENVQAQAEILSYTDSAARSTQSLQASPSCQ